MKNYIFHIEPTPVLDRAFDASDFYLDSLRDKISVYGGSYDLY